MIVEKLMYMDYFLTTYIDFLTTNFAYISFGM